METAATTVSTAALGRTRSPAAQGSTLHSSIARTPSQPTASGGVPPGPRGEPGRGARAWPPGHLGPGHLTALALTRRGPHEDQGFPRREGATLHATIEANRAKAHKSIGKGVERCLESST